MQRRARAFIQGALAVSTALLLPFCGNGEEDDDDGGAGGSSAVSGQGGSAGDAGRGGKGGASGGNAGSGGAGAGGGGAAGAQSTTGGQSVGGTGGAPDAGENSGGLGGADTGGEGGSTDGEGGADDGLGRCGAFEGVGTGAAAVRALSLVTTAPWQIGQGTAGMIVDSANRVYVADFDTVYVVEGTSPSAYLTIAEAQSTAGVSTLNRYFLDMDIAPDGSFYLLTNYAVLRSTAPHVATLVQSVTQSTRSMGVVGNGHVAVGTIFDGLWSVTSAGSERRYTNDELGPVRGCGAAGIATTSSGLFLFEPACNPSALWRGNIDGSGVERVYEAEPFGINPLNATTFTCITRDPQGGFYVIGGAPEGPVLFHLCEGATRFAGYNHLPTTPSFSEAATGLAFEFCSIASAADGTLFVQTFNELWKVAPN